MPKQVTNVASDDALTTIYRITNDENEEAKAARISERLGIRAASVSGMLARLKRDRLILIDKKKNELKKTEKLFFSLMGRNPELRLKFIKEKANFVKTLDI